MQRLTAKDTTVTHRKAIRHHASKLRRFKTPLHQTLLTEATQAYDNLKAKTRGYEDIDDAETDADADLDTRELELEDAIRDLDDDLTKFDRKNPEANARAAVFPNGFGEVIDPEGEAQLTTLPALHVRLEPFRNEPALATSLQALADTEKAFNDALAAAKSAAKATKTAAAEEAAAKTAVRQQLESAHGRLRDFYKARPAKAERFFMKLGRREGKEKEPETPTPTGGGTGGGTTGGGTTGGGTGPTGPV